MRVKDIGCRLRARASAVKSTFGDLIDRGPQQVEVIRAVRACWHPGSLEVIAGSYRADERICDRFLRAAFEQGSPVWNAVQGVTKGPEVKLPEGAFFVDHAGIERKEARIRWWLDDVGSLLEAGEFNEISTAVWGDDGEGEAEDE
jgi:hypothetical protein